MFLILKNVISDLKVGSLVQKFGIDLITKHML